MSLSSTVFLSYEMPPGRFVPNGKIGLCLCCFLQSLLTSVLFQSSSRQQISISLQEARYETAMVDLKTAEEELNEKERELAAVQQKYEAAVQEKRV